MSSRPKAERITGSCIRQCGHHLERQNRRTFWRLVGSSGYYRKPRKDERQHELLHLRPLTGAGFSHEPRHQLSLPRILCCASNSRSRVNSLARRSAQSANRHRSEQYTFVLRPRNIFSHRLHGRLRVAGALPEIAIGRLVFVATVNHPGHHDFVANGSTGRTRRKARPSDRNSASRTLGVLVTRS